MLRLWRDRLHIALTPERIVLLRVSGGPLPKVLAKTSVPVVGDVAEGGWKRLIETLSKVLLADRLWQDADTSIVLSNYFVRYQLVAWSDAVDNDEEREAYVRASFSQVYGEGVADWVYTVSETGREAAWLAGAIDRGLFTQLIDTVRGARATLVSLTPHLMPAFNAARREIKRDNAWFVQVENQKLLLGLILGGHWQSLSSRQMGDADWSLQLPVLLDREWRLNGVGDAPRAVYIFAPEAKQSVLEGEGKWVFHWLRPKLRYGLSGRDDSAYGMAMGA